MHRQGVRHACLETTIASPTATAGPRIMYTVCSLGWNIEGEHARARQDECAGWICGLIERLLYFSSYKCSRSFPLQNALEVVKAELAADKTLDHPLPPGST